MLIVRVQRCFVLFSLVVSLLAFAPARLGHAKDPGSSYGAFPGQIELVCVDDQAAHYATFQSHNQKVVANRHGIFFTYLRSRNKEYTAQTWRLMRSTDGGKTFAVLYEETNATNPPVLETDAQGNVYLMRVDFQNHNGYLYHFSAASDFRDPRISAVPGAAAGKYSMRLDPVRKQLYFFSHNDTFHVVGLDGRVRYHVRLLKPGKNAVLQYPLLDLAADGTLHAAWTTQQHGVYMYWDIHHMLSRDGGRHWSTLDGRALTPPITADDTGPTLRITPDDEFPVHTWLSSLRVKNGKLHFVYWAQSKPPREHYMRYDIASGRRDQNVQPVFGGKRIKLWGLDGFFATHSDRPDSPLYCVMQDDGHLACLISMDNGTSWKDFARTQERFHTYSIGGFRELTDRGDVIGTFTDSGTDPDILARDSKVYFFRIGRSAQPNDTRK